MFKNNLNFFQSCFAQTHISHVRLVKCFVSLVNAHAHKCVSVYVFLMLLLSLGLFQIEFDLNIENLAIVRNSRALEDKKILSETFGSNQYEARKFTLLFMLKNTVLPVKYIILTMDLIWKKLCINLLYIKKSFDKIKSNMVKVIKI